MCALVLLFIVSGIIVIYSFHTFLFSVPPFSVIEHSFFFSFIGIKFKLSESLSYSVKFGQLIGLIER